MNVNFQLPNIQRFCLRLVFFLSCLSAIPGCKIEVSRESGSHREQGTVSDNNDPGFGGEPALPVKSARVLSYNIQFLNEAAANQGDRIPRLRRIIADIKPDVVGVQEVDNRAAMELVFPPDTWQILIDDDSNDRQDTAIAVRRPWNIANAPADLDADDVHFLAPGAAVESFFPVRRDALFARIATPDNKPAFTVVVVHAKARVGGRANTDHRRVGASRYLVEQMNTRLKGQSIVLLGDFNDSPDDISLNILETGDPNVGGGPNAWPGDYMVNLFQPLWEQGQVTSGASHRRLNKTSGLVNNVYQEARARNNNARGRDAGTGPIMFDQILVSKDLAPGPNPKPGEIYLKPLALSGEGFSRPSDHLPVYADIPLKPEAH